MREKAKSLRHESPRRTIARDSDVTDHHAAPDNGEEMRSRKELGSLFNVSHEAIRLWEENGKLKQLGWERIPKISSPAKYSRTNPLIDPISAQD